ncbi:MAG: FG-GAP-like repeat-containing protein [Bacteroidota bacterium]|nr:FG-GAP-like repeat-containing protein [Bacteroidota bacterium]
MRITKNFIKLNLIFAATSIIFNSCNLDLSVGKNSELLFKLKSPSDTNLNFSNKIVETNELSVLSYNNMYMGGGVSIGDINNDKLPDIFLTANQESNKLYLNKGNLQFEDITNSSGIAGEVGIKSWSTGSTMVDINNDGLLDIYVCMIHGFKNLEGTNKLYINQGDNTFLESASKYGLDIKTYAHQAAFFDYDIDGDLDMFLLNQAMHTPNAYRPGQIRETREEMSGDLLFKNENGKFIDVSDEAGIYGGPNGYGLGLNISDFNNDGYPDIYVSNDFHENDYLYYNNQKGGFKEDIVGSIGHTSTFSMGNDVADINNDGWMDIITLDMRPHEEEILKTLLSFEDYDIYKFKLNHAYHFQYPRNMLQLSKGTLFNKSSVKFSEVGEFSGVSSTDWSWGALFADYDLDGKKDLIVTNGIPRRPNNLDFINFEYDKQEKVKELSNLDLISTIPEGEAPNVAYRNNGVKFEDVSKKWGLDLKGTSNGIAYSDLDNDGDFDIVLNNLNAPLSLYENKIDKTQKKYLKVKFKGSPENTFGIGNKVFIKTKNGKQFQELFPTRGWISSVEPVLIFGIDNLDIIDEVKVRWFDGKEEKLINVPANRTITFNYEDSKNSNSQGKDSIKRNKIFKRIQNSGGITFKHRENDFVDFKYDNLMPRMISNEGPKVAVADVNGDGLDDFYIGGAKNQSGELYIQTKNQNKIFKRRHIKDFFKDRASEDVGVVFFDIDNDDDMDLYVVSGGGESFDNLTTKDRLYINDGFGNFNKSNLHPQLNFNGSCAVSGDFNSDGNLDIFVGVRSIPGSYGKHYRSRLLLGDGKGALYDYTEYTFAKNVNLGMVTDAVWLEDSKQLVVVGEWMPITIIDFNVEPLGEIKVANTSGWWNAIEKADVDGDGDEDLLIGNFGLNTNLKASVNFPVSLYLKDFDDNSKIDPIMSYFKDGNEYPYYSLDEMAGQLVKLKKEYRTYQSYANSKFEDVFPNKKLMGSERLQSVAFESVFLENKQSGKFAIKKLPIDLQMSPIYGFAVDDFNHDGITDLIAGGNFYANQINIGKCDASYGHLLTLKNNNEELKWKTLSLLESGFAIDGEVRDIKVLNGEGDKKFVLVSKNNENVDLFSF